VQVHGKYQIWLAGNPTCFARQINSMLDAHRSFSTLLCVPSVLATSTPSQSLSAQTTSEAVTAIKVMIEPMGWADVSFTGLSNASTWAHVQTVRDATATAPYHSGACTALLYVEPCLSAATSPPINIVIGVEAVAAAQSKSSSTAVGSDDQAPPLEVKSGFMDASTVSITVQRWDLIAGEWQSIKSDALIPSTAVSGLWAVMDESAADGKGALYRITVSTPAQLGWHLLAASSVPIVCHTPYVESTAVAPKGWCIQAGDVDMLHLIVWGSQRCI